MYTRAGFSYRHNVPSLHKLILVLETLITNFAWVVGHANAHRLTYVRQLKREVSMKSLISEDTGQILGYTCSEHDVCKSEVPNVW